MEIIVFTGVQGCGKSTIYEKQFKDTHVRVNLDTLKTRKNEDKLIAECIEKSIPFIVDNTNVTIEQRKKYINIAKENNYKIISYYIPTTKEVAIARNNLREGKAHVAKVAIYTALKRLVEPSKEEGFDELYIVDNSDIDYKILPKL